MKNEDNARVQARKLERYLTGAHERRLVGKEALKRMVAIWQGAREEAGGLTDAERAPARVFVAWRLTRALMSRCHWIGDNESIVEALEPVAEGWCKPRRASTALPNATRSGLRRPDQMGPVELASISAGLALTPVGPDDHLERYLAAMSTLARDINVAATKFGRDGLVGLLDPATAFALWPSPADILHFESVLVIEAMDLMLEHGERGTIQCFSERYGLGRKEALLLLRLCKTEAMEQFGQSDVEEDRAILAAKWKELISRAKEAMNPDLEMKALKELGKVLGVTRTEPTDNIADMVRTVKNVNAGIRQQADAEQKRKIESDDDALAEYDAENPPRRPKEDTL